MSDFVQPKESFTDQTLSTCAAMDIVLSNQAPRLRTESAGLISDVPT